MVDTYPEPTAVAGPWLRIELASDFDLVAQTNGNIYVFKHTCGFWDEEERLIDIPFAAGDPPLDLIKVKRAMARDAQGRAKYWIYMRPKAEAELPYANAAEPDVAYDLRSDPRDLCLRISQSGYFLTASHSRRIQISHDQVLQALAQASSQSRKRASSQH